MFGYILGTDVISCGYILGTTQDVVGTFWVQKQKKYTFVKSLYPLKCLASPDHTFFNVCKFLLCSYKEFGANSKFSVFLKKISPARTKKVDEFSNRFMPIFNLHINGPVQCLKNRHWFFSNFCLWN